MVFATQLGQHAVDLWTTAVAGSRHSVAVGQSLTYAQSHILDGSIGLVHQQQDPVQGGVGLAPVVKRLGHCLSVWHGFRLGSGVAHEHWTHGHWQQCVRWCVDSLNQCVGVVHITQSLENSFRTLQQGVGIGTTATAELVVLVAGLYQVVKAVPASVITRQQQMSEFLDTCPKS